ncbi:hypothetical protein N7G274_003082 [Stereocaulon virgatum]|uniref:1,3-beta-glucanosyltransferase n=1 Tax=Stereocaulon virgatum TaxID=373712 RepID=A0ABR4AEX0_9LECA
MSRTFSLILAILLLYATFVSAVQNVKVQGADFVNSVTSNRLQIIGVAYQPGGSAGFQEGSGIDPLSNGTLCLRDAALMQQLGVNTIRIYNLDPKINHDLCVSIFNAVGIYMLIDVNSPLPNQSLDPGNLEGSYSSDYLNHIFSVVEAFKGYPNTLGFFGGNENMNTVGTGGTVPPYLRAVTRDLKNYIAKNSPRTIPVGYSAADVAEILTDSWAYLSCNINGQANDPSRSDFFGLNSYTWCGPTSPTANYQASGYDTLLSTFGDTSIPVFFSEYGCNKVEPRVFDEVPVLYGNMTSFMSGGLVYEYYEETSNNFGLVSFYSNDTAQLLIDYDNLQKQFNTLNIKALQSMNSSATSIQSPKCSTSLISSSGFNNSFNLPSIPSGAQTLIDHGISNPNQGKLVTVTDTAVTLPVYSSGGTLLKNLAIKPLPNDESNTPGGTSTSSGASPSTSKKGAAGRIEVSLGGAVGTAFIMGYFFL